MKHTGRYFKTLAEQDQIVEVVCVRIIKGNHYELANGDFVSKDGDTVSLEEAQHLVSST